VFIGVEFLKLPFRMFLKMSSACWERLLELVVGCWLLVVGISLTGNFVSMIFFRTAVLRSVDFLIERLVGLLLRACGLVGFLGSMLNFLIVRKTFRST